MDSYNYESFGQCEIATPDFRSVAKVGDDAPDFYLKDLVGRTVSLSALKGKKRVILEFGSIT